MLVSISVFLFVFAFLFVAVSIILPSIKRSFSGKRVVPDELDLNSVRDSLMEKQGWTLERAEAARAEYIRFLTLLQLRPRFMVVPWPNAEGHDDLDQFWHQHILDTAKYADDCNRMFGQMIHHNPHIARGSGQEREAVEKTQRLYARTFASGSYGRSVDAALLTGCSACATVDSHSSGDGGHGHGGHSCGGHSCGGHGCGHGCGGH
jgi:uncharacterized membrane protein YgcG